MEFLSKGVRMQFYALEIARYVLKNGVHKAADSFPNMGIRNRAGLNDWIYEHAHPEEKKSSP